MKNKRREWPAGRGGVGRARLVRRMAQVNSKWDNFYKLPCEHCGRSRREHAGYSYECVIGSGKSWTPKTNGVDPANAPATSPQTAVEANALKQTIQAAEKLYDALEAMLHCSFSGVEDPTVQKADAALAQWAAVRGSGE